MNWFQLELKGGLNDVTDRAWREVWNAAYSDMTYDATNALFRSLYKDGVCALYFTPSAADLASTFGATRCRKPRGEKLVFVAGASEACSIHFPWTRISRPAELAAAPEFRRSSFFSTQPVSAFPSTRFV